MTSIDAIPGPAQPSGSRVLSGRHLLAWFDDQPMSRRRWQVFVLCSICLVTEAFDLQLIGIVAPIVAREWALTPQVLGLVISAALVGLLLGSFLFGALSDIIGRRPVMQLTIGVAAAFCGFCALAGNALGLGILRLCTGLGIGGALPVATVVMSETMPTRRRGGLIALWSAVFPFGGFLAAAAASIVLPLGWQWLFVIGAMPILFILVVRAIVPETPHFLVTVGDESGARQSVRELVSAPIPPAGRTTDAAPVPGGRAAKVPVSRLFRRDLLGRTLLVGTIWFCWLLPYYGLVLWLPTLLTQRHGFSTQQAVTFVLGFQIAGIVGRATLFPLVDKLGRKPVMVVAAATAAGMELVFGLQGSVAGLIAAGCVLAFFHDGGFDAVLPYAPELYPTEVRATGVGWANGLGRVAAIIGTGAVGFIIARGGIVPVFVMFAVSFSIVSLVVAAFGIETKKAALHNIS